VALQVQEVEPAHVAELGDLEGAQVAAPGEEALDVVVLAGDVDRDALVPHRPVQLAPVGHRSRA
jgi:hypothetical protein